jgi:hypothetical protein
VRRHTLVTVDRVWESNVNSGAARTSTIGRTAVLAAGLLVGLTLAVAGCSGRSHDGAAATPNTASAAVQPSPAVIATTKPKTTKVTPSAICAVIQSLQPSLDKAAAPDDAQLTLQVQISSYFSQVNAKPRLTGAALDKTMKKNCPDVRKAALKPTGKKSFAAIL